MKPTLDWCNAAVEALGDGARLGGGSAPDLQATFLVVPSRMSSPIDTGTLGSQVVASQVDVICYALQTQDGRISDAATEVWARVNEQVEEVHQLGDLGVAAIEWALPNGCDYQVAEPNQPWFVAATVTMELIYMRTLATSR